MYRILRDALRVEIITEVPPGSDPSCAPSHSDWNARRSRVLAIALRFAMWMPAPAMAANWRSMPLNNPYYMLEGLGFRFVASPRHADVLLVTGPVSRHMATALKRTYEAIPEPKLVVAIGDCGRDGGVFGCSYATLGGVCAVIPVDVVVPGCPPSPIAVLQGLITAVTPE